jgi:adenylate kinase
MIIAITGTPGTGKTSISKILEEKKYKIVDLNKIAFENNFLAGIDEKRDTKIVDIDKVNEYVKNNYVGKGIVFIEGHLSHLLECVDKVIVLRRHPDKLRKNLTQRGWKKEKINENVEAEFLDIVLCEAAEIHPLKEIIEIDTTDKSISNVTKLIIELTKNKFKNIKKYKIGRIDWSEEILK